MVVAILSMVRRVEGEPGVWVSTKMEKMRVRPLAASR